MQPPAACIALEREIERYGELGEIWYEESSNVARFDRVFELFRRRPVSSSDTLSTICGG
jgi:hypothetical protein